MWKIFPQINFITDYKKELITYTKFSLVLQDISL